MRAVTIIGGEQTISQLAAPFAISFAAASKHVKALEHAGLIQRRIRGRTHVCRLDPRPLAVADHWLRFYEQLWTTRLDALAALFEAEAPDAGNDAASTGANQETPA